MIARACALFVLLALVASPVAAQTGITGRTLGIGATPTPPDSGTTVRISGLASSGTGQPLWSESDGDVFRRALAKGDLPAVTVFTDQANTFGAFTQAFGGAISGTSATFSTTIGVTGVATLTGGFLAGANSSVTGTFGVSGLSTLTGGYASSANSSIAGNLTLTGTGAITAAGDIAVNGGDLTSSASVLNINPGGRLHLVDNTTFADNAGTNNYASQTTGWRITAPGAADFRYLFVDEMHAKAFIADLEMALNGGMIVAKSTATLASAFTCPAAGGTATVTVNDFPGFPNIRVFAVSDWVVLRTFTRSDADSDGNVDLTIGDCVGQVSAYVDGSGTQSWTFTRGSGGNAGAMAASTVVPVDAPVVDFGVSGQGFLIASANDGAEGANAPYWQAVTWTTAPVAANMTLQTRWGQLNGSYGYSASTYGFAAGPSTAQHITADPTNGFRIRSASTTWGQMNSTGLTLGVTATGNGNLFADTSGNLFLRSGTVNRILLNASNGTLGIFDDDGTTQRVSIGPTTTSLGGTSGARLEYTYSTAQFRGYDGSGNTMLWWDASNGLVLGPGANGSDKPYMQLTGTSLLFCQDSGSCTLSFDGATGNITSTGNLSIQGAASIGGSGTFAAGNVSLGASGISITPSTASADWDSTRAYRFPFTPSGAVGGMYAVDLSDQGNVFVSTQGTDYTHSHFTTLSSLIEDGSGGDAGVYSATISAATGDDVLVNGARAQMRVADNAGTNTLTLFSTALQIDGVNAVSATKTVRNAAGTGTCTLVFTFGILTGGSC